MLTADLSRLRLGFIAGTLGGGGAERQLYYILRTLHQVGTDLRVLCLTRGEFWEQAITELGIEVKWVGSCGARPVRLARIIADLRRWRPDIIQSQHFYTNLYTAVAARALGSRSIGAVRNDVTSEIANSGRILGRLALRLPHMIAANSNEAASILPGMGVARSRICLLENVVDTDRFAPTPRSVGGPVTILSIGRLVAQKRHDLLLAALGRVRGVLPQGWRAIIVGDGPLRGALQAQIDTLALGDLVRLHGHADDVVGLYACSDILVLASDHEGMPNVVLEAMSSGLPVVATRVGGVRSLLTDGADGSVVEPGDEQALASAIASLIADPVRRRSIGEQARRTVSARHGFQALACGLASLYSAALAPVDSCQATLA